MNRRNQSIGLGFIFLGIIFLLENLSVFQFNFLQIWPVIVALVGLGFLLGFANNRQNAALLMPGVILIIYGGLFLYCRVFGWENIQTLWPLLLIAPGLGFLVLYLFNPQQKNLLWPSAILIVLGFLFLFRHIPYLKYWPVLLVILGVVLIFRRKPLFGKDNDRSV